MYDNLLFFPSTFCSPLTNDVLPYTISLLRVNLHDIYLINTLPSKLQCFCIIFIIAVVGWD